MELRAAALWMSGIEPEVEEFALLLKRAISGDVSAFERIIVRYERRVLSLAWRLLGRPEDAQDASQEVFLRAFRYLHRFDRRRPFEPWLMKMTLNVCHDLGRKRRFQVESACDPDTVRAAGSPHDDLHSGEQKKCCIGRSRNCPRRSGRLSSFATSRVCLPQKLPKSWVLPKRPCVPRSVPHG